MKDINKINIKIEVAGRQYPISTPREDEEALRRVRDEIVGMIKNYRENYEVRDMQDILALCVIQLGMNVEKQKKRNEELIKNMTEKLNNLSEILS